MSLILKNAIFIDWKTLEFRHSNIMVEEGINGSIHFHNNLSEIAEYKKHIILDCTGKLVTKSFAVGHHHAYSAFATGMSAPKKKPENFTEILQNIWWKLDKALDKDMIEASALVTAIACAKNGATFVIDHHASPDFIEGSLEIIAKAFEKTGIGHLLCYEISDRDGQNKSNQGLHETENYLEKNQGLIGLHASFTLSDETLKKAAQLMEKSNSGIHIHVAEDVCDQEDSTKHHGKRVVERLKDFGFLDSPKTILAHCLHLSDKERDIIKNSNSWVVQNAESNLNNKVGHFNSKGLGRRIFLGTDGMHSNMIRSSQWAHFAGLEFDNFKFGDIYYRLRNVHHYLSTNNFTGDGENNLVILDYPSPTPINHENFLGHFFFGVNSSNITTVISNGKIIVRDRKVLTINEQDVLDFANKQAMRLWKALGVKQI